MTVQFRRSGFTVIEVILVLAITSALAVGILAGVQSSITSQRYNDSINSFQAFLQDQYHQVISTSIQSRDHDNACLSGVDVGRTPCFVVGRMLVTNYEHRADGTKGDRVSIATWDVVATGLSKETIDTGKSATELFKKPDVRAVIDPHTRSEHALAWDAGVYNPTPMRGLASLAVLILKSPLDGSILTYAIDYDGSYIQWDYNGAKNTLLMKMIADEGLTKEVPLCVVPAGMNFLTKRAVVIRANGSNSSAVEIAPLDEEVNKVQPVKC